MLTMDQITSIVDQCKYPGWKIIVRSEAPTVDAVDRRSRRQYLQVRCDDDVCNVTGDPLSWGGRKWRISPHMTKSEIVGTALKAVLTAVEHEAREKFTYRDVAVYGPHLDVDRLHALASSGGVDARK